MPEFANGFNIYSQMSQLAAKFNAVDLAQGAPGIDGPKEIREHAAEAMRTGSQQYTNPDGIEELRKAIVTSTKKHTGVDLQYDRQVVVTAGSQEALCAALISLLNVGDEVVIIEPYYNPVVPIVGIARAVPRFVSLSLPDFRLDEDALMAVMSERTRLIVYNNPNNPCGRVLSRDEVEIIGRVAARYDCNVLADEVYQHFVFDGRKHVSALEVSTLVDRCCVISSVSKTYLMSGWRIGWAIGTASLIERVAAVHRMMSFCQPYALSEGARFAIENLPDSYLSELAATHERKRDYLVGALRDAGINAIKSEGTIFVAVDIANLGEDDDLALSMRLPEEAGVAVVPMSPSWHDRRLGRQLLRLCFCKSDDTLEKAAAGFRRWRKTHT